MLRRAATTQQRLTEQELIQAAHNQDEAEWWAQLDNNLKYILVNILSGLAATTCRQHQAEIGLEVYRQLNIRFSIPIGTRSACYLTQLFKPTFDHNNFEDSFPTWEFELSRYERDNNAQLPDAVKIPVLLNNTTGPLQQHLQLNAGANPTYAEVRATIMEYYRTTTAFQKLQQTNPSSAVATNFGGRQAPMDIGAINKGKHKGKSKGKNKGKYGNNKGYKGKGYNKGKGYGNNYNPFGNKGGKGKIGQGMPFRGMSNKEPTTKPKEKDSTKAKEASKDVRCGQQGHIARDCKMTVYNISDTTGNNDTYYDTTDQWYQQQQNMTTLDGAVTKHWSMQSHNSHHTTSNTSNWHCQHQLSQSNRTQLQQST